MSELKWGFRVAPLTVKEIRRKACATRRGFEIDAMPWFNLKHFVERLYLWGITIDVVDDTDLPAGVEAACAPEQRTIYFKDSVYRDIRCNDPRARFTVFHELGHLLLAHNRTFQREQQVDISRAIAPYESSEWQADLFAAEVLMPLHIMQQKRLLDAWSVHSEFQVSYQAAEVRLAKLRKWGELPVNGN